MAVAQFRCKGLGGSTAMMHACRESAPRVHALLLAEVETKRRLAADALATVKAQAQQEGSTATTPSPHCQGLFEQDIEMNGSIPLRLWHSDEIRKALDAHDPVATLVMDKVDQLANEQVRSECYGLRSKVTSKRNVLVTMVCFLVRVLQHGECFYLPASMYTAP